MKYILRNRRTVCRFLIVATGLCVLALAVVYCLKEMLNLNEIEEFAWQGPGQGQIVLRRETSKMVEEVTFVEADNLLPSEGIRVKQGVKVEVSASGYIATGGDAFMPKEVKDAIERIAKREFGERVAKNNDLAAMATKLLKTHYDLTYPAQWRTADGSWASDRKIQSTTNDIDQYSNRAKLRPDKEWGCLLGTIAENRTQALANVRGEHLRNWGEATANRHDSSPHRVFAVGFDMAFRIKNGGIVGDARKGDEVIAMSSYSGDEPRLFLLVNDGIATTAVLDKLIEKASDPSERAYFELQKDLLVSQECGDASSSDKYKPSDLCLGLWYGNNRGRLVARVTYSKSAK